MEVIAEQIAELSAKANAWLNFALVCAWIGFGLSVIALAYLLIGQYRNMKGDDKDEMPCLR